MRASRVRTFRYDSRALRRNHCVTITISGSTEKCHERQPPVHEQQHDHDPGQREHVAEHRDHARAEQIIQGVYVGRHACHQPTDRVAVIEAEIEALQVARDLHPQIEHDPLARQLHGVGLGVLQGERSNQYAQEQQPECT